MKFLALSKKAFMGWKKGNNKAVAKKKNFFGVEKKPTRDVNDKMMCGIYYLPSKVK